MFNELLWGDTNMVGLLVLGWAEPSYHLWCSASRHKPLVLALCATHLISKTSTISPCPHLLIPLRYCQSAPDGGYSVQEKTNTNHHVIKWYSLSPCSHSTAQHLHCAWIAVIWSNKPVQRLELPHRATLTGRQHNELGRKGVSSLIKSFSPS